MLESLSRFNDFDLGLEWVPIPDQFHFWKDYYSYRAGDPRFKLKRIDEWGRVKSVALRSFHRQSRGTLQRG